MGLLGVFKDEFLVFVILEIGFGFVLGGILSRDFERFLSIIWVELKI